MLRPAPVPAASDCRAPREAMGFTEEVLLEVGDEPVRGIFKVNIKYNKKHNWQILHTTVLQCYNLCVM